MKSLFRAAGSKRWRKVKNISYTSDGDADPVRLWRFDGGVGSDVILA